MTIAEKREYIRSVAMPCLMRWVLDIGAIRAIEILDHGTDDQIEDAWKYFEFSYARKLTPGPG